MTVTSQRPPEELPPIGTVEVPVLFSDCEGLLIAYEIAPVGGGGSAILEFSGVGHFEHIPIGVEGLDRAPYPAKPWDFTEIFGSDRSDRGPILTARFWTMSFNDVTVAVVFETVRVACRDTETGDPDKALRAYLVNATP